MIDPLLSITLPQFLSYQPGHHALDPLFPNDSILRGLEPWCIRVVYSLEAWWDLGLFGEEEGGFWSWHAAAAAAAAACISADDVR